MNTLKWNSAGTLVFPFYFTGNITRLFKFVPFRLLASGSDDRLVKIWDLDGDLIQTIETGHAGNVFGVEVAFLFYLISYYKYF